MTAEQQNAIDNLTHADEFTQIENTALIYVLRGWFGALIQPENATAIVQASDDVWALTTLAEHFTSELNSDPSVQFPGTRTETSKKVQKILLDKAKKAQDVLNQLLHDTNEDERINALTHKVAQEVVDRITNNTL